MATTQTTTQTLTESTHHPHMLTAAWFRLNWPMLSVFTFGLMALLTVYATVFIQREIAAAPPPPAVTRLSLDLELVKNDAAHNKNALERIETNVDKLDDKLDRITEALLRAESAEAYDRTRNRAPATARP